MRIPIPSSLFLLLANTAMCQINKGQFLLGGNASFESIKTEGDGFYVTSYKTTNLFLSPNIGYFIISKLAGGLRLNVSIYNQGTPVNYSQTDISLSPFLRYYLLSRKQRFNILADVGYIHSKNKKRFQGYAPIENGNGYNLSAGPSIFLNQHVALEFLLGYKQTKLKNEGNNKTARFNTSLGLQIHLGKIKSKGKSNNNH
jgi:outer membrane protein with beta-barrel domain